jgi:hypothetical protein
MIEEKIPVISLPGHLMNFKDEFCPVQEKI